MTFAKESTPFVLPFVALFLLLLYLGEGTLAAVSLVLALLLLLFFRIPRLVSSSDESLVLAPAFGRVTRVDQIEDPLIASTTLTRVVTFLSVFDVHVQRCPVAGVVETRDVSRGLKVPAFRDDAAEVNTSELSVICNAHGDRIGVRQVVGLVARRIVCYLREEEAVERGELMGLIKFGSRVDLLIPSGWEILVKEGDRMRGGETPVARRVAAEAGSS